MNSDRARRHVHRRRNNEDLAISFVLDFQG